MRVTSAIESYDSCIMAECEDVYVPRLGETYSTMAMKEAINGAIRTLGYTALRSEQLQAVERFVSGRDVLVSLPTGCGKSLCYGCLPLVFDSLRSLQQRSIVVAVSPLNSLMQDQVASFTTRGLKASYIHKEGGGSGVLAGEMQLVYASPEAFLTVSKWREMLRKEVYHDNIVCLAVDEAHLVHKWCV